MPVEKMGRGKLESLGDALNERPLYSILNEHCQHFPQFPEDSLRLLFQIPMQSPYNEENHHDIAATKTI